jgi:hypothetical protein
MVSNQSSWNNPIHVVKQECNTVLFPQSCKHIAVIMGICLRLLTLSSIFITLIIYFRYVAIL